MAPENVPHPPYERMRDALGDDPAAARELESLHAQLHAATPEPDRIAGHVDVLSGVRTIEAIIANWWDDPATQLWVKGLTDAGL